MCVIANGRRYTAGMMVNGFYYQQVHTFRMTYAKSIRMVLVMVTARAGLGYIPGYYSQVIQPHPRS